MVAQLVVTMGDVRVDGMVESMAVKRAAPKVERRGVVKVARKAMMWVAKKVF